jgi:cytidylate kinase
LFVTASPQVRAGRRLDELARMGLSAHYDEVLADILARDARDRDRAAAPLAMAEDAVLLDTSELGVEAATGEAIAAVARRLGTGIGH